MRNAITYSACALLESVCPGAWLVLLIDAGTSRNSRQANYPADTLKRAVQEGVFENMPARAMKLSKLWNHLPRAVRDAYPQGFADVVVGAFDQSAWSEKYQGITARLTLNEAAAPWFEPLLKLSHKLGGRPFGWSIDGDGRFDPSDPHTCIQILSANAADFVTFAARGGRTLGPIEESELSADLVLQLAEAYDCAAECGGTGDTMKNKLRKMLGRVRELRPALLGDNDTARDARIGELVEAEDLDTAVQLLEQAATPEQAPAPAPGSTPPATPPATSPSTTAELLESERAAFRRQLEEDRAADLRARHVDRLLEAADLPERSIENVRLRLQSLGAAPDDAAIQEAINAELMHLSQVRGTSRNLRRIEPGMAEHDKLVAGFSQVILESDGITDQERAFDPMTGGLHQLYRETTGDVSGRFNFGLPDGPLTTEMIAESTAGANSLANVLQEVGNRRLEQFFVMQPQHALLLASVITDTSDYKLTEVARLGGFGVMPPVTDGQPIQAVGIPGDDKIRIATELYGNRLSITDRMIRNNDLGAYQAMLQGWATSAMMTLEHVVISVGLLSNPEWGDSGKAIFHADRGNIDTSRNVVSDPFGSFTSAETMLKSQTANNLKTGDDAQTYYRYGLKPHFCLCGPNGESAASSVLITPTKMVGGKVYTGSGTEEYSGEGNKFFRYLGQNNERLLENRVFSNTTVVTIWIADPKMYPTLQLQFLDGKRKPTMQRELQLSGQSFDRVIAQFRLLWGFGGAVTAPESFALVGQDS